MDETPASSAIPPAAAPEPAPAAPPPVARSIGERLRAGRERSGLSIAAAAEKLHLDPKVIEALEADRFAEIGASVYVRGHLKRYADFVGETGGELVAMYNTREARAPAPDLRQVPTPERRADPRRLVTPLVVLGSSSVLLLAIWWVLAGSQSKNDPGPTPAQATPVVAGEPAPLPDPSAVAAVATPAALTTSSPGMNPSGSAAGSMPATPAAAPVAREAPAREIELQLELASDSWVEVYDSAGSRLYYDIASGGSVQSFKGRPPFRVMLGDAAAVAVVVDGQKKEIPANAADGDGARFVVNRSGSLSRSR
jgi:cytoskeleton protein RodZ